MQAPIPKQNPWKRTPPLEEVHNDNLRDNRTTVRIGQEEFPELTPPTRKHNAKQIQQQTQIT